MSVYSVPVVIGVDEEKIAKGIEKDVEKRVINAIKDEIWKVMFDKNPYNYGCSDEPLRRLIKVQIDEVLRMNEDKIVKTAATMLAEKLARTKAVLKEEGKNEDN